MNIIDMFSLELLDQHIDNGYITRRVHPKYPLAILNYSDKCQYEQLWDEVTTQCRGLIYSTDLDTFGDVIARPFPKFFNYGQPQAAQIPLTSPVVVTDKMDGSLGIIYPTPDGNYSVATRGSFTSDQAIKAAEMLKGYQFDPYPFVTYLVEIIYPDNRIVLDYGQEEKLVLLGTVGNEDGFVGSAHDAVLFGEWGGPIVDTLEYKTLTQALTAEPRPNAEGMVVRDLDTGGMVKIKQEDYIRLHKLVFGLSEKAVWEHLSTHNGDITGMLEGLPDEFHRWVQEKADDLTRLYEITMYGALSTYGGMRPYVQMGRKVFAEKAAQMVDLRAYLFALLDGKDISPMVWKSLKPKGATPMVERNESVA